MLLNKLLKRNSDLEFEVEKLEKNVHYKYINGQAYFRQDYVLGREKEIERLHSIIKEVRELCEHKIEMLELQLRNIMEILTPENGYLKYDIEAEIGKYKELLEILDKGSDKE